jgi:uncharacterized protein
MWPCLNLFSKNRGSALPLESFRPYVYCFFISLLAVMLTACNTPPDMRTAKKAYEKQDYTTAQRHYQELAEFGIPEAKNELGKMYLNGRGVEPDPQKALTLFKEAQKAGENTVSTRFIAKAQAKAGADAIKQGDRRGIELLEEAAAAGDANAYYYQAQLYQRGELIPKDPTRAVQLYQSAADKGYYRAYIELGKMYEKGKDVPQDYKKAENYYVLAKQNGLQTDKDLARIQAKSG